MICKRTCRFKATLLSLILSWGAPVVSAEPLLVVANPDTPVLDDNMVQRLFQGKVVQVAGKFLTPVNLPAGNATREKFIQRVVKQDDEDYIAYWTVRKYIGKGVPPRELTSEKDLIEYIRHTPGAVGYVDGKEQQEYSGLKVLFAIAQ